MIIRGNTVGTNMSVEKIAEKIGTGGGGGVAPLIVTLRYGDGEASETSESILTAVESGLNVYLDVNSKRLALTYFDEVGMAYFADYENDRPVLYSINSEGYFEEVDTWLATVKDIGNISSALDELHTYAQGLINGGDSG